MAAFLCERMEQMKVPLSNRLRLCAAMVPKGARVADIGTDHGYLGIYLLQAGVCPFVTAADLREQPLAKARENAVRFGTAEKMQFLLSDGLQALSPDAADTIVMAGMGGDLIIRILQDAPWVCSSRYTLILQPQSGGQALRQYLAESGFCIVREELAQDGQFLYTVLLARKGTMPPLSPGRQYVSDALLQSGGALLIKYLDRLIKSLSATVQSLQKADQPERLRYYETALAEIKKMREEL